MDKNQLTILHYLNEISGYTNWYKLHRKFFGGNKFQQLIEDLPIILATLEKEGMIVIERVEGEMDKIKITEKGRTYL